MLTIRFRFRRKASWAFIVVAAILKRHEEQPPAFGRVHSVRFLLDHSRTAHFGRKIRREDQDLGLAVAEPFVRLGGRLGDVNLDSLPRQAIWPSHRSSHPGKARSAAVSRSIPRLYRELALSDCKALISDFSALFI